MALGSSSTDLDLTKALGGSAIHLLEPDPHPVTLSHISSSASLHSTHTALIFLVFHLLVIYLFIDHSGARLHCQGCEARVAWVASFTIFFFF